MCRITFSKETVKQLKVELRKAYERGDLCGVRRLSVLVMIGEQMKLSAILGLWNVSAQTVYNWLKGFTQERWKSLEIGKGAGRPARLTKTQKRKLSDWIHPCLRRV